MRKTFLLFLPIFIYAKCIYKLNVEVDIKTKLIKANATISSEENLEIDYESFSNFDNLKFEKEKNLITLSYQKKFTNYIKEEFIHLLGSWYPQVKGYCSYEVDLKLPKSFEAIVEADSITTKVKKDTKIFNFKMPREIDNISLIASTNFVINSKVYNDINISTYFFKNDENLSQKYLKEAISYIKSIEKIYGKFPYKRFSIVENEYQTGYSMPTFTLIGSKVMKKEYIFNSLKHEILHQYFGNSLFNNPLKGNYIEGLVTYLSDFKSVEYDGRASYRRDILNSYELYTKNEEFEPYKFTHRYDRNSMTIGYSKVAFIFYMLKNELGGDKFYNLIAKFYKKYQFKEANIKELEEFFEKEESALNGFFRHYFYTKGMIKFDIKNLKTFYDKEGFWLEFNVVTNSPFYRYSLNLEIETYEEKIFKTLLIDEKNKKVSINLKSEPLELVIDRYYELFRKLTKKERSDTVAKFLSFKDLVIVKDTNDSKYEEITDFFKEAKIISSKDFSYLDLKNRDILLLDRDNELKKSLFPTIELEKDKFTIDIQGNIYNLNKTITLIHFPKKFNKFHFLRYYGKYTTIVFDKNQNFESSATTSYNSTGIEFNLNQKPTISKVQKPNLVEEIIENIKDKKIIYVSEHHTNLSHHLNQLRVIKVLYKQNRRLSIGMEMFISDSQKVLDDYIEDKIDLNGFLKQSNYYKNWGYDYNLYKPIIDFAKENRIKIVALNIDRDVTKEISKNGIFALSKELKAKLPKEIDDSLLSYKEELDRVLSKQHSHFHKTKKVNSDFFYQAKLVWDEIMAENIDKFLSKNRDYQMVVIAGSGHLKDKESIPARVFRRNALSFRVLFNDEDDLLVGDYLIKNYQNIEPKKEKKIGVLIENDNNLTVKKVFKESFSDKKGLKKGDFILSLDNQKVTSIYDLKRVLYFIDDLNSTKIEILRDKKVMSR